MGGVIVSQQATMRALQLMMLAGFLVCWSTLARADYEDGIEIETLLETETTVLEQPFALAAIEQPRLRAVRVVIPPGAETGWHVHDIYAFAYILSGTVSVEFADGKQRTYTSGEAFAEAVDTVHNGVNRGPEPVEIILFAIGERDAPLNRSRQP